MFPKKLWPTVEMCREHVMHLRAAQAAWNEAEVLRFLQHFYQRHAAAK